eukprot:2214163-Prymnesium_polylepis.1
MVAPVLAWRKGSSPRSRRNRAGYTQKPLHGLLIDWHTEVGQLMVRAESQPALDSGDPLFDSADVNASDRTKAIREALLNGQELASGNRSAQGVTASS